MNGVIFSFLYFRSQCVDDKVLELLKVTIELGEVWETKEYDGVDNG